MAIRTYIENEKKYYEVYVNGSDSRGVRTQRKRTGIETLRKAEQIEFELKRELAQLREEKVPYRWHEWLEECFKIMKMKYQPSTYYTYDKGIRKWLIQIWEKKELREITASDVHEFLYEKITDEQATVHTRKFILKLIKLIFQMAMDSGKIDRNPCHGINVRVPETEKKVLMNSEVEIFLREARVTNHRFYPIWVMALFTGMRSGELYALKWTDIDLEASTISVNKAWNSKNGFTPTKNQKCRVVPISNELLVFLRELKIQRCSEEFVLPHPVEWTRGEAARVIRPFCKSIGVTNIRFHDLRATFITNLLARGEPLVRVMAIVGHSDMETTNIYLRKAGVEVKGATDRLGYKVPNQESAQIIKLVR